MKALSLVWYKVLPALFGGQQGIAYFNQALGEHIPLDCLCSSDNAAPLGPAYNVLPLLPVGKKQFTSAAVIKQVIAIARQQGTTHIILEHPYHLLSAWLAKKRTGAQLILHAHNIEYKRFRDLGKWWWPFLYLLERAACRLADLVLFKTREDVSYAIHSFGINPGKSMVVPYGINSIILPDRMQSRLFLEKRLGLKKENRIFLFSGTLDYRPNAKAVENIYTELAPRLYKTNAAARIVICGRKRLPEFKHLSALDHPAVVYAGEVDDILPFYAAADAYINPVSSGGGVQTKNIFALSCHLPLVCFSHMVDAQCISMAPEMIRTVANNKWDDFAGACLLACGRKDRTPVEFFEYYRWDRITQAVAERMKKVAT